MSGSHRQHKDNPNYKSNMQLKNESWEKQFEERYSPQMDNEFRKGNYSKLACCQ